MNKTLIIAAVSALAAGGALAQSSVTIYGRFNLSLEDQKNISVDGTQKVEQNNASRLGFKGTEDIGGGLKAGFVLEHGFNADTGTASGAFWGRDSEVTLSGGFGTLRLGNFISEAYFASADYVSMHNHDTGTSSDMLYAYVNNDVNKIAYRLPTLAKTLSIEAAVSAGEGKGPRSYDFATNYDLGDLHLGLGYAKTDTAKEFAVRGLYQMGAFIFGGYIQRDTDGFGKGLGDRTNYRLSGAYIVGSSEFHLNFGSAGNYSKLANSAAKQYTVAYNYNLSKRTRLYTFYTKVDNGTALSYFGARSATGKVLDPSSIAFGIRHNF